MKAKKVLAVAVVAACSVFAGAAVAQTSPLTPEQQCQVLNGYKGEGDGYWTTQSEADGHPMGIATTWGAVRTNSGEFKSRNYLKTACMVKEVQSPKGAGKPQYMTEFAVPNSAGMRQDECSLLNSIAQVHSKVGNGKTAEALAIAEGISNKAILLNASDPTKLTQTGLDAILEAAARVEQCIAKLPQM